MTTSAVVYSPISATAAEEDFVLAGANAKSAIELKAIEVQTQEEQSKGKLMPTHRVVKYADPLADVKAKIDAMTSEQRTAFVGSLEKFQADVAQLKTVIAGVKDPNKPLPSELEAVAKAAAAVRGDVQKTMDIVSPKGRDPIIDSGTSIWFVLAQFMVNDVMGMNNMEMSAAMKQVDAQSKALANVSAGLGNLNATISNQNSTDTTKSVLFAAGVIGLGMLLAIPTGGLSLVAGIAIAIAFPVCNNEDNENGVSDPRFSFLGDSTPDSSQLLKDQNSQQMWSLLGTNTNQQLSTVMQLHVQQTSQLNTQSAQQFSTMINYASQTMSTGK